MCHYCQSIEQVCFQHDGDFSLEINDKVVQKHDSTLPNSLVWGSHGQIYVMGFWMLKASLDLASICLPDQSAAIQNSLERGWSFKKHYIWSHCFGMTKSHWAQQLSKDVDQVSLRISHLMIGLWLFCRWRGDLDPEIVFQLTTWFSWTQPSRNDFNLYGEKIKLLYFTTWTPIFTALKGYFFTDFIHLWNLPYDKLLSSKYTILARNT